MQSPSTPVQQGRARIRESLSLAERLNHLEPTDIRALDVWVKGDVITDSTVILFETDLESIDECRSMEKGETYWPLNGIGRPFENLRICCCRCPGTVIQAWDVAD